MLFLHVGLHKTGTTFFQSKVFPHWEGVVYLSGLSIESYLKADLEKPCLASRESFSGGVIAHQNEKLTSLKRLSTLFPEAKVLISFRDHGSYLNAVYSQYLRYGGTLKLPEFFDLEHDSGYMKHSDLMYRAYIEGIEGFWGHRPFVYLLSELKQDSPRLLSEMAEFMGTKPFSGDLSVSKRRNVSLGLRQAALLRRLNGWSGVSLHRDGSTRPYRILRRLGIDPPGLCQRWSELSSNEPIMSVQWQSDVNELYTADWEYVNQCKDSRLS